MLFLFPFVDLQMGVWRGPDCRVQLGTTHLHGACRVHKGPTSDGSYGPQGRQLGAMHPPRGGHSVACFFFPWCGAYMPDASRGKHQWKEKKTQRGDKKNLIATCRVCFATLAEKRTQTHGRCLLSFEKHCCGNRGAMGGIYRGGASIRRCPT